MSCSSLNFHFLEGEKRKIQLDVYSCNNDEQFIISSSEYEVFNDKEESILTGDCSVVDKTLSFIFEADYKGVFKIIVTFVIAEEILKNELAVTVT